MDEILTDDPEQLLGYPEIFYPTCQDMGIELDVRKLPDHIIGMDPPTDLENPYPMESPPPPRHLPALNDAAAKGGLLCSPPSHSCKAENQTFRSAPPFQSAGESVFAKSE